MITLAYLAKLPADQRRLASGKADETCPQTRAAISRKARANSQQQF